MRAGTGKHALIVTVEAVVAEVILAHPLERELRCPAVVNENGME